MVRLVPLLVLVPLLLVGCVEPPPSEPPVDDGCVESSCGDVHCAPPVARLATGRSEAAFEFLEDGDPIAVEFGGQNEFCCYHLMLAVETEGTCPIVWLQWELGLDDGSGDVDWGWQSNRHVQMPRYEGTRQRYWGIEGMVPCEWWPDDPERPYRSCTGEMSSHGHIEDVEAVVRVTVKDHDDRIATDTLRLDPWCCDHPGD